MITLNKIAYTIAYRLGKPDDFFLREQIKESAIGVRAMLLRRDVYANSLSREYLQSLGCIKLVCVDIAECCNITAYETILRTDRKVPKPTRLKDTDSFYYVGTIDKKKSFSELYFDMIPFLEGNKYTKNKTYYIYLNGYIYIVNPPTNNFKYINVIGVFSDPSVVSDFSDCQESSCYSEDDAFPIAEDLIPALEMELIKMYSTNFQLNEDKEVKINDN